MTTPIIWYDEATDTAAPYRSEQPDGAVPYMLARPMPIETAPRDGTWILGWLPEYECWAILIWDDGHWCGVDLEYEPSRWLPLPPAPEEA